MTSRALLTLLLVAVVPSAEAYVRSRTARGNFLFRTDNQNIVYLMNDQTAAGMTNADGEVLITADSDLFAALQGSLAAWDAVSSADVTFAPLARTPLVNDTDDNNHVFVFLDTPEIRSFLGPALAVTRTIVRHERREGRKGLEVCNCSTDEGRPLGTGLQEQVPNQLRRLWSKAMVVSTEGKGLGRTRSGDWQEEDRKRTTDDVSKA